MADNSERQAMNKNTYISAARAAVTEITVKKSRFICNITHVQNEADAAEFIEKIKKQHYNAKHNVFAYILNDGTKKYTDDGEPSKTAGLPILEMIEKQGITDVVCVVTRYFGGILLGTGGLVRAYTEAAASGLEKAGRVVMELCDLLELRLAYSNLGSIEHLLKKFGAKTEDKTYLESICITASVKHGDSSALIKAIGDSFGPAVEAVVKGQVYREV